VVIPKTSPTAYPFPVAPIATAFRIPAPNPIVVAVAPDPFPVIV